MVTSADGADSHPDPDLDLVEAVETIRQQLAQPGTGAWFSATFRFERSGKLTMDADYDHEPAWEMSPVPETYAEEQELFPRDIDHQPDWYQHKLRQAAAGK